MRKGRMLLALGVLLAAGAADARGASSLSGAARCRLPPGWDQVAARGARFVVFGEMHGTQQSPRFLGDVACALAARGERLLVAVEHFSTVNGDFQKAWALPDADFVPALTKAGWAGRDDGVGSEAMLAMLVRLHRLARAGYRIDIVAFSGVRDEAQQRRFASLAGQGPHDAAQAENIREAAARRPYDHVLILVGNAHARKSPVTYTPVPFEPMAMQLGKSESVVSLNMKSAAGTIWNCGLKPDVVRKPGVPITNADIACGAHPATADADLKPTPFIALRALPGQQPDPDYDGVYWLGPISASPPAVPDRSPPRNP